MKENQISEADEERQRKPLAFEAKLKRQVEELRILNNVAAAGAEATDVDTLIQKVSLWLVERLYPDNFAILIADQQKKKLSGFLAASPPEDFRNGFFEIPFSQGISGQVAVSGEAWRVADVSTIPQYFMGDPRTRSELCVPIKAEGQVIGVINAESSQPDAFSEEDEQLFASLAGQLATAISKIRLLEAERLRLREAEALGQATAAVVSSLNPDHLLDGILSHLNHVVPSRQSMVVMIEGEQMRVVAGDGFFISHSVLGKSLPVDHALVEQMLDSMHPQICIQQPAEHIQRLWGLSTATSNQAWMTIPLIVRSHLIGFLSLFSDSAAAFSESEAALAQVFANQAASAIENARLFEQTNRWALELEALTNVSSALRQARTAMDMVPILIEQTIEIFQADAAALFLLNRDMLILAGESGADTTLVNTHFSSMGNDPLWEVIRTGEMLFITQEKLHNQFQTNPFFDSLMKEMPFGTISPLKTTSAVVGLLYVAFSSYKQEILQRDRLLTAVSDIAGNALHRASIMETLEQRVIERTRDLTTLYSISEVSSKADALEKTLAQALEKTLEALNTSTGSVHLLCPEEDYLCMAAHYGFSPDMEKALEKVQATTEIWDWRSYLKKQMHPVLVVDLASDKRVPHALPVQHLHAYIGIPFGTERQPMGVLSLFGQAVRNYSDNDVELLTTIAEQIRGAVERDQLQKQAEEVAIMEERQRLARELHDSVTQEIYSASLMANAARKLADGGNITRAKHYLEELGDTAQQALKEMRLLIYEMRPSVLENNGLLDALRQRLEAVERRAGIEATLHSGNSLALPPNVEDGLYRITIEALNNILKHSAASSVSVRVEETDHQIILEIIDDGCGFDWEHSYSNAGMGLKSMQERTDKIGGVMEITSTPDIGTRITIRVK